MRSLDTNAEARLKPSDYQPSKAEMEETIDMPGADAETIHKAFFTAPAEERDS